MSSTDLGDEAQPDGAAAGLFWLALYLVDLAYGGPEEGGWWYQAGTLVVDPETYRKLDAAPSAFMSQEGARRALPPLDARLTALNEGRPPIEATNSVGIYEWRVIQAPTLPTHFPTTRPHYE